MGGPRLRASLASIPSYKPGVAADEGAFKISSNENPYPPLPSVLAAMQQAMESINRYPDLASGRLVEALARRFDVPADHLALGTGSVGVAQQIAQVTSGPGDEIVYAWRSFEAYPIITQLVGATSVQVPLDADEGHDLPAMLAAITDRTRLVFVCTPNNPTSAVVDGADLEKFLDAVPSDVLVVLDEAYVEFVRDSGAADGLALYRSRPNVCVLRTFSKAYGLAGVRVGFVVAHPEVAEAVRKAAVPFGVSTLAQVAAIASLDAEDELRERVELLVAERTRVLAALRAQGWTTPESQANFVWLRLGNRSAEFGEACSSAGVVVRPYGEDGVRVTIGEAEASDRFLAVAARFDAPRH